jgi:hypothetical protein
MAGDEGRTLAVGIAEEISGDAEYLRLGEGASSGKRHLTGFEFALGYAT